MRALLRYAVAGAAAVALAGPAAADDKIVALDNPGSVALALRDLGYRAQLDRDDDRPVINSGSSGTFFYIKFFGCKPDKDCTGVLFETGFDLKNGLALESVNDWNREKLMGRAYLDDECDPWVDHFLVADPLMSRTAFARMIKDWDVALSNFRSFVGYDDDAGTASVATCGLDSAT